MGGTDPVGCEFVSDDLYENDLRADDLRADDLREAVRRVLPQARADLRALIKIPSVSADPAAESDVARSAQATAALFRSVGAPAVEILDGIDGGKPAVLAAYPPPPGRPTVLLYAHHDVQPAGDPATWASPPFEPTERDGRLYGRGSADDKAGIVAHLTALRAFGGRPPVGVTVFVEGEEEIGSGTLGEFLRRYHDRLAADVIVLADSANFEIGRPALTTSLRGLVDCTVEVRALAHPVHSGMYGGAAPDALTALCRLLTTLHDEKGDVAISGLLTAKAPEVDISADRFRQEASVLDGVQLIGTGGVTERLWTKPAATVLAMDATRVADASNTLAAAARAKVSLRVAPGDDAERAMDALAEHLRTHAPWGVQVTVTAGGMGQPYAVDAHGPAFDAARRAFGAAYGNDVVEIGVGGTIPFIAAFAAAFPAAAILVTSAGADPDCRAHGADESLHLGDFERACLGEALLLAELAEVS
jgi:acetylornithine deacetylase/succinyl-diaminopimelate desuccinylase-like protein